jgi:hypothetical protein
MMGRPPKVREVVNQKAAPVVEEDIAPAPSVVEGDVMYGMDVEDMELHFPMTDAPEPPDYVLKKFKSRDLVYRWMSKPMVRYHGMRMYTTYSPDLEDKRRIDAGQCRPGIFIDAENKICWREDAFLATIPRKLHKLRQEQTRMRTQKQTDLAKNTEVLSSAAERMGAKAKLKIDEWIEKEE